MRKNLSQYTCRVRTRASLQVGTVSAPNDPTDSLFRRDSANRLLLPGTSIAGALRGHLTRITPAMTRLPDERRVCDALSGNTRTGKWKGKGQEQTKACACIVCHLMGDIRPLNTLRQDDNESLSLKELEAWNGRASRLIIHDAVLPDLPTVIRDGVGIDRVTGVSARAASAKFDFEVVPAGTEFDIFLELEDTDPIDGYLFNLALHEWQAGRVRFGGGKSRGSGVLDLVSVNVIHYELTNPAGLGQFLLRHLQAPTPQPYNITAPSRDHHGGCQEVAHSVQSWIRVDFDLEAEGFFLTNDMTRAAASGVDQQSLPLIPGASLRGVIRSQAERIARTIANLKASNEAEFLAHCAASDPFVTFSTRQQAQEAKGLRSSAARIHDEPKAEELRQCIENYDLAEQLFGSVDWGSRLAVEDAPLVGEPVWKKLDFVAIDRFTGGAADGAKFDAYALWKPTFRCCLYLESPQGWEIGWLLLALRDLRDGRVSVGAGGAKGFGAVTLRNLKLTLGYAYPEAAPAANLPHEGKSFFLESVYTDWQDRTIVKWMGASIERIRDFSLQVEHQGSKDPYWNQDYWPSLRGQPASVLYPGKVKQP
ncbi:MAG: hypothetical protein JNM70_02115 [Anaerolineae bacterium]|nr:hypothetical protein [Anaerolineae bacterium]